MKKIIFSVLIFASLFAVRYTLFPDSSYAACQRRPTYGCPTGTTECSSTKCCDTLAECATPPPSSAPIVDPMDGCPENNINTAIGCIPVADTNAFMGWILGWAVGVGGGIAFLLIVYASFMIMTSQGDPTRLKAGQELLTSAISGLIMLIFSIFILKFIGVDILGLNNFGFGG